MKVSKLAKDYHLFSGSPAVAQVHTNSVDDMQIEVNQHSTQPSVSFLARNFGQQNIHTIQTEIIQLLIIVAVFITRVEYVSARDVLSHRLQTVYS
jgi:hypothetical protein